MALSKELLKILACPRCRGEVISVEDGSGLLCSVCRLKYPIRNDIPVMLVDEAEEVGDHWPGRER